jgi:hypothetical protein
MQSFAVYLYVTAVGFVTAGLLTSFVQLISGQPMRFGIEPCSVLASVGAVLLRVLAGPAILMRNAWRGIRIEARPKGWFCLSGDRGDVESVIGCAAARRDFDVLTAAAKRGAGLLARPALVKARWGRGWVGDGHRALFGSPGLGVGVNSCYLRFEADTVVCGAVSGGSSEIQTSGLRSD